MATLAEESPRRVAAPEEGSENSSDVELPDIGENMCPACEQEFGEQDQDAPDGHSVTFTAAKAEPGSGSKVFCLKCTYVKRGSFKQFKQMAFLLLIAKNPQLKSKFRSLRKRHVKAMALNPRAKPRHETVDVKLYTKKSSSRYIDFRQECEWQPVKEFFDAEADAAAKRKLRSIYQKKAYLIKRGFKIQKDETGEEGVVILPSDKKKKVLIGTRLASTKEKCSEHADKDGQDEAFEKHAEGLEVEGQTKEEAMEALQEVSEEEDEEDEANKKDDDESSEESGFGLKSKGAKNKNQKKKPVLKRFTKKAPEVPPSSPVQDTAQATGASEHPPAAPSVASRSSNKGAPKPEKVLAQADSLKQTLKQVIPVQLWQHPAKAKEFDSKIHKALEKCSQLGQIENNTAAQKMKDDLSQLANSLASWIEIVTQLKVNMDTRSTKSVMAHFEGQAEPFANILEKQTVDCQKTVLHDLGKVLLEVCLSSDLGTSVQERGAFFQYISLSRPGARGLLSLFRLSKGTVDEKLLLQVQTNVVNMWVDKLRSTPPDITRAMLLALPAHFNDASVLRIPKLSEKDATSLLPPEGVDFENTSGLGLQALQDFQKLYGCKQVVDEDKPMESFSVQEKSDMKTRVTGCDKYSARLNLLFRTNVTLKKLWTRGLDLAKCAMTGEQAVKKATELMNLGRELADAMKSSDFTQAQDVDNLTKKLSAVSLFLDVAEHIPDSQKEVENAMRELVAEIKELCDQKAPVNKFDDLATWLDQQWVDKEGSFRLTKSDELANVMPSLEFRGQLCSIVLKSEADFYLPALTVMRELHGFCNAEGGPPSLMAACTLQKGLVSQEAKIKAAFMGSVESLGPSLQKAVGRLDECIQKSGDEAVHKFLSEQGGADKALEMLGELPYLSSQLTAAKHVLSEHEVLHKLPEDIATDFLLVTKNFNLVMKLAGFRFEIVETLFPEAAPKLDKWVQDVQETLQVQLDTLTVTVSDWKSLVTRYRPILDVAEFWQDEKLAEVKWMFEGEAQTNQDMKTLVDTREDILTAKLGPVKALIAGMPGCKSIERLAWLLTQFDTVRQEMEEQGELTKKVVSNLMCADIVINKEKYSPAIDAYRKVCKYMASKLGSTPTELPSLLKQKLDNLSDSKTVRAKAERSKEGPGAKTEKAPPSKKQKKTK